MPSQQQQQQQDAISGSPGGSLPNLPSPLRGTTIGAKGPGFYPPPYAETMGPLPTAGGAAQHNPQQQVWSKWTRFFRLTSGRGLK